MKIFICFAIAVYLLEAGIRLAKINNNILTETFTKDVMSGDFLVYLILSIWGFVVLVKN